MFDLTTFVADCRSALSEPDPTTTVKALVRDAIADPQALEHAIDNAEGVTQLGPARFIVHDDELTVVDIGTPPGLRSPVHNHNMWAVIGVYNGEEHNTFFTFENDQLEQAGERLLEQGDVAVLSVETNHAIANPLPHSSNALHVYGGDLFTRAGRSMWNPTTSAREDYDIAKITAYVEQLSAQQ
jgi:predicted metal-dependent enzyme (double-stranded beta helix superfamily)